jgi:hypothetical protein
MPTDPTTLNLNTDRLLRDGKADVVKLHKKDYEALLAASGSGSTLVMTTPQTNFFNDVTLGKIDGVRNFLITMNDTITKTTVSSPKLVWDIDIDDRTDLVVPQTMYISSNDVLDVGNLIVITGVGIIGGVLKEIIGYGITNGHTQVEVVEIVTDNPITFFRVNDVSNQSSQELSGILYVAETDPAPLGVPADSKIQSFISILNTFTPTVSVGLASVGAYCLPQELSTGETVLRLNFTSNIIFPDDTFKLYAELNTYDNNGVLQNRQNIPSAQSGDKSSFNFILDSQFSIEPGQELKYKLLMGSNQQTFSYFVFGLLNYIPNV